jgi:outer membrane biosynthesis protein TonB
VVSPTPRPSPSPTPTARPSPSPTPSPSPSPTPTARPSPSPTPSPSPSPTAAPSPAPRALADAVDAYLAGRYDALVSFNVDQFSEPRARWHALILRAAARYTRASLQGDAGAPLLAQAQADIRAAKGILSPQSPDPQLFSPRFRQLFASTR